MHKKKIKKSYRTCKKKKSYFLKNFQILWNFPIRAKLIFVVAFSLSSILAKPFGANRNDALPRMLISSEMFTLVITDHRSGAIRLLIIQIIVGEMSLRQKKLNTIKLWVRETVEKRGQPILMYSEDSRQKHSINNAQVWQLRKYIVCPWNPGDRDTTATSKTTEYRSRAQNNHPFLILTCIHTLRWSK